MKENGLMIKLREKVFIYIKMVHHILESGLMINNMGMVSKNGLMEHNIKDIFIKV